MSFRALRTSRAAGLCAATGPSAGAQQCAPFRRAACRPNATPNQRKERLTRGGQPRRPRIDSDLGKDLNCSHFDLCSGCSLSDHAAVKRPPVADAASGIFKNFGIGKLPVHLHRLHRWRCRAKLAVRGTMRTPIVGLFKRGSHTAVDIPFCQVHHPRISTVCTVIRNTLESTGVRPYDEDSGGGDLRYVQLTAVASKVECFAEQDANASVQVVLVSNADAPLHASFLACQQLGNTLWQLSSNPLLGYKGLIHSVWINYNHGSAPNSSDSDEDMQMSAFPLETSHPAVQAPARCNTIFGRDWQLLHGNEWCWQRFGGAHVCLAPGSFVQANYGAVQRCVAAMSAHVPRDSALVDLYGGVGALGLALTAACGLRRLTAVERNPACRQPFVLSAQRLQQQCRDKGLPVPDMAFEVAAAGDSPHQWLLGADVLVVDPPRRGLDKPLLDALCEEWPTTPGGSHMEATRNPRGSHDGTSPPSDSLLQVDQPGKYYSTPGSSDGSGGSLRESGLAGGRVAGCERGNVGQGELPVFGNGGESLVGMPQRLLYLSCEFEALRRDMQALTGCGRWRLSHAEAFLFFPGTDSIETLAIFDRC